MKYLLIVLCSLLCANGVLAQNELNPGLNITEHTKEISVVKDQSKLLNVDHIISEISIANPRIADALDLENHKLYLLGKEFGATTLTITFADYDTPISIKVNVTPDISALMEIYEKRYPNLKLEVYASGGKSVVSGTVNNQDEYDQVIEVAYSYSPGGVVNLLQIQEPSFWEVDAFTSVIDRDALSKLIIKPEISNLPLRNLNKSDPNNKLLVFGIDGVTLESIVSNIELLRSKLGLHIFKHDEFIAEENIRTQPYFMGNLVNLPMKSNDKIKIVGTKIGLDLSYKLTPKSKGEANLDIEASYNSIDEIENSQNNFRIFKTLTNLYNVEVAASYNHAILLYSPEFNRVLEQNSIATSAKIPDPLKLNKYAKTVAHKDQIPIMLLFITPKN